MDELIIKVRTEVLKGVVSGVTSKINHVQKAFSDIDSFISLTSRYWESVGHNTMLEQYSIRRDDYSRIFSAMNEHFLNLQKIAGIYEAAEKSNTEMINELSSDVIV